LKSSKRRYYNANANLRDFRFRQVKMVNIL